MLVAHSSLADIADFILRVADIPTDDLKITAFEGTEGISELFRFRVDLCSHVPDIDLDAIVGKPCLLQVAGSSGTRLVNGIVRGFERTGEGSRWTYYSAEIVPCHWLMTQQHQSRVFVEQRCPDMSVPGIIKKVLTDAGIPQRAYRFALEQDYQPREFVVQYRESAMDFIARLMEEEGIFYFFEHSTDGHCMVIGDSRVAHAPNPQECEFPFRDPNGLAPETEYIFTLSDRRTIRPGAVCLDDFNFKQPKNDLKASVQSDRHTGLEFSDYPGEYVEKAAGGRYAQIRLEERQRARRVANMRARVRALLPGYTFRVFDHPNQALNREFLLTRISHTARQPQSAEEEAPSDAGCRYEAQLHVIPADVPFRPPRVAPRPTVLGSQTAIVVGPKDEEIHTDEYGRVKVQFHWDRSGGYDEHSSFWIRVSQGLAGGNYGMMFLPRVGQEVIVDFLEGDPDRPIITGRVYNNDHMPPYALPAEKTRSCIKTRSTKGGGGSNEIRFDDAKDNEQLLLYGQKDLHLRVNNDRVENVGNDRHLTVDHNKIELIKADKSVHVQGNESYKVDGTLSLTCVNDLVQKLQANHKHQVAKTYAASAMNIKLEAASAIELKCGGSSIILTPAAIFIVGGPLVNINSGSGPPVAPVGSQATEPEAAIAADTVVHGSDTRYGAQDDDNAQPEPAKSNGRHTGENAKKKTCWIEIELVDEADQPVPSERYELRLPDGRLRRGRLDANGFARVNGIEPGTCEICFPKLDAAAWERI